MKISHRKYLVADTITDNISDIIKIIIDIERKHCTDREIVLGKSTCRADITMYNRYFIILFHATSVHTHGEEKSALIVITH